MDQRYKARRAAQESHIYVQIAQSEFCVERAKKRLADAFRAELVAGQACVARLKAAAEQPVSPSDVDEIVTLRAKLAVKKFATRSGATTIQGQDLPLMPKTRIPHDLYSWMQQSHQELRVTPC